MIAALCAHCGKGFNTWPSAMKNGRKFCSQSCKGLSKRRSSKETFNLFVVEGANPADCWDWKGMTMDGYGFMNTWKGELKRPEGAHRVSYALHVGPIPDGMHVLHRCDNRICSNPRHLFLGTNADNVADMVAKGRQKPGGLAGQKSHLAKLTEADVRAIRANLDINRHQAAALYGVSASAIWNIRQRRTWRHIP